jgi:hypothetical protein
MFDKLKSAKELAIEDSVNAIKEANIAERNAIVSYRDEIDPDYKESYKEDAYLNRLIQIRESRLMGKKDYDKQGLKKYVGVSYNKLHICDYEEYEIK